MLIASLKDVAWYVTYSLRNAIVKSDFFQEWPTRPAAGPLLAVLHLRQVAATWTARRCCSVALFDPRGQRSVEMHVSASTSTLPLVLGDKLVGNVIRKLKALVMT